jgi:prevent-host-death family protein
MKTVGAFEAKTHLAQLLEHVQQGEEVLITRHGRPVARLVPSGDAQAISREASLARLSEFRRGRRLGDLRLEDLRDEGRRR